MVQSQARLRSKSSPESAVVALSRLCEARACLRDREVRRVGSVARRWDSAAAALRFRRVEVLARAWRAEKRARRSVGVVVEGLEDGEAGGWPGESVDGKGSGFGVSLSGDVWVGGSWSCVVDGGGAVCGCSASSGAVAAVTLRFFEGGISDIAVASQRWIVQDLNFVATSLAT